MVVVVVDRVTGADDIAVAVEVAVGATEAVLTPPRLKLGGAAEAIGAAAVVAGAGAANPTVKVGGLAAVAVDTAEPPRVRPTVLATVPAVDDVGNENPPIAGAAAADVVVVAGAPKLKPPDGAAAVPGAVDVAAGAPNEKPPAAVLVAVLPSPRDNEGVDVAVDAPNEGGLATETLGAGAVAAGAGAANPPVTVGAIPPNENELVAPAAVGAGAAADAKDAPPNPNDGALAAVGATTAVFGATEPNVGAGAAALPKENPEAPVDPAEGAPNEKLVPVAAGAAAGWPGAAPNAGAAAGWAAPKENPPVGAAVVEAVVFGGAPKEKPAPPVDPPPNENDIFQSLLTASSITSMIF